VRLSLRFDDDVSAADAWALVQTLAGLVPPLQTVFACGARESQTPEQAGFVKRKTDGVPS